MGTRNPGNPACIGLSVLAGIDVVVEGTCRPASGRSTTSTELSSIVEVLWTCEARITTYAAAHAPRHA